MPDVSSLSDLFKLIIVLLKILITQKPKLLLTSFAFLNVGLFSIAAYTNHTLVNTHIAFRALMYVSMAIFAFSFFRALHALYYIW